MSSILGKIPTPEEYHAIAAKSFDARPAEIYKYENDICYNSLRYLNFDQYQKYVDAAQKV